MTSDQKLAIGVSAGVLLLVMIAKRSAQPAAPAPVLGPSPVTAETVERIQAQRRTF